MKCTKNGPVRRQHIITLRNCLQPISFMGNGILLPTLFWLILWENNDLMIEKNFGNSRLLYNFRNSGILLPKLFWPTVGKKLNNNNMETFFFQCIFRVFLADFEAKVGWPSQSPRKEEKQKLEAYSKDCVISTEYH